MPYLELCLKCLRSLLNLYRLLYHHSFNLINLLILNFLHRQLLQSLPVVIPPTTTALDFSSRSLQSSLVSRLLYQKMRHCFIEDIGVSTTTTTFYQDFLNFKSEQSITPNTLPRTLLRHLHLLLLLHSASNY